MEYICPEEIAELFDDSDTIEVGRLRAVEWLKTLNLEIGDSVFLPEVGWVEKTDSQIN